MDKKPEVQANVDYTEALSVMNDVWDQVAGFVRAIVTAFADGRVSPVEIVQLSLQAVALLQVLIRLISGTSAEVKQQMLYVLEHGDVVMNEG